MTQMKYSKIKSKKGTMVKGFYIFNGNTKSGYANSRLVRLIIHKCGM